jgi:branched-chain amino acid transport system ATP-binding protein
VPAPRRGGAGTTIGRALASILECTNVTKAYEGLLAVRDVSFAAERGEVFAVIGPNGAGKTTLFDVISGLTPPTGGTVVFDGAEIQNLPSHEICRRGLVRTFQTTVSFVSQTVLQNVLIGSSFGRRNGAFGLRFQQDAIDAALDALELCGLLEKQSVAAGTLPMHDRKRLMLATALATEPTLLMLDEPVGGLNARERADMIALIRRVRDLGITVLMIEHVVKAVQALANRMLVLHHGSAIAEGTPAAVLRDARVVEVYLGGSGAGLATPQAEGAV